jgi:transposase-like protein
MVGPMSLSQEDWEGLVAEWRRSGKAASRFAEEHGLPATALRYWINRPPTRASRPKVTPAKVASARTGEGSAATPALAKVVRPGDAPTVDRSPEVRVMVGKFTIVVDPGFDDVHLRAVVRALSELA